MRKREKMKREKIIENSYAFCGYYVVATIANGRTEPNQKLK